MAGKGFTVKKDWDNPREHAMPDGVRVPAEDADWAGAGSAGYGAGADGGSHGYRFQAVYSPCQRVYQRISGIRGPGSAKRNYGG